jgi:hypothetical protein
VRRVRSSSDAADHPSATTAESSDSIAPSRVKEIAAGKTAMISSTDGFGSLGNGRVEGMPPNFVPIVSTERSSSPVAAAVKPTATSIPGQCGRSLRSPRMMATVTTDSPAAVGVRLVRASQRAGSFFSNSPGSC